MLVYVCVWSFYIYDTRKRHFYFDSVFVTSLRSTLLSFSLLFPLLLLYTYFHYCNYLPIFTLVATYVLTLYWFQIWLLFCHCVLPKLYIINFLVLQAFFRFFSPHIFPAVTVNCDKREKTQINEFEWHSLSLPFNSDQ